MELCDLGAGLQDRSGSFIGFSLTGHRRLSKDGAQGLDGLGFCSEGRGSFRGRPSPPGPRRLSSVAKGQRLRAGNVKGDQRPFQMSSWGAANSALGGSAVSSLTGAWPRRGDPGSISQAPHGEAAAGARSPGQDGPGTGGARPPVHVLPTTGLPGPRFLHYQNRRSDPLRSLRGLRSKAPSASTPLTSIRSSSGSWKHSAWKLKVPGTSASHLPLPWSVKSRGVLGPVLNSARFLLYLQPWG